MEINPNLLTITGTIEDARTREPIVDANIYLKSDRTNSTFSNQQGLFSLEVDPQLCEQHETLIVTAAGYERYRIKVPLLADFGLAVHLTKRVDKTDRTKSDSELVSEAIRGSQQAYTKLMERYRDSIFFMVQKMINNREDADDIMMDSFGRAFSSLEKYDNNYAFSTWLYRIAINNCIDFIRKKRLDVVSIDEPINDDESSIIAHDVETNDPDPEQMYIKEQRVQMMKGILSQMKPKYRSLIELRYFKELSYEEIAVELDIPAGTVKARLFRAKELLSHIVSKERYQY